MQIPRHSTFLPVTTPMHLLCVCTCMCGSECVYTFVWFCRQFWLMHLKHLSCLGIFFPKLALISHRRTKKKWNGLHSLRRKASYWFRNMLIHVSSRVWQGLRLTSVGDSLCHSHIRGHEEAGMRYRAENTCWRSQNVGMCPLLGLSL